MIQPEDDYVDFRLREEVMEEARQEGELGEPYA
jgi:hypothetical protein